MIDTLKLSRNLAASSMEPKQADSVAAAFGAAFAEDVATKVDLNAIRTELKADIKIVAERLDMHTKVLLVLLAGIVALLAKALVGH